jgi:hypothetical protein
MILLILAVLFVLFVVECILIETEGFGWATVTLLLSLGASVVLGRWFHVYSVVDFVRDHGVFTLVYAGAYVGVGIAWSFVKWFSYLMSFRDAFRSQKEAFIKDTNERRAKLTDVTGRDASPLDPNAPIPTAYQAEFKAFIQQNARWTSEHRSQLFDMERPRASKNKARITAWACYWPFSFVGTLLNDPVRRLFNLLFNWFKALYQQMSDWVFRNDGELK